MWSVGKRGVRRARVDRVGGHLLQRLLLRQRVLVAGGVAVEDPDDLAVDHGRQRVGVDGQPRRDLLHPLARRAVVEDLAVLVDPRGQQDVGVAELHRVEQLAEDVADPDAVLAGVGVGLRLAGRAAALRDVELDVLAAWAACRRSSRSGSAHRSRSAGGSRPRPTSPISEPRGGRSSSAHTGSPSLRTGWSVGVALVAEGARSGRSRGCRRCARWPSSSGCPEGPRGSSRGPRSRRRAPGRCTG